MIRVQTASASVTRRVDPEGELADVRKQIVATPSWVREIEEWAKRQPGRAPGFSEAVRYLVTRGIRADDEDKKLPRRERTPKPKDPEG